MPDPVKIRSAMQSYIKYLCESDVDGIMSLYSDDASVEDPVGTDAHRGAPAVRAFYAAAIPKLQVELTGPIRVAGNECAMPMLAKVDLGDRTMYMDVIDVMKFDDDSKVVSMRAFWNAADTRSTR
jgi:steroid delta-isomerase